VAASVGVTAPLGDLTAASFAPHTGTVFTVDGQDLVLEAVEAPNGSAVRPFSLLFSGSPERTLDQQTHLLRHAALGELAVFLVPLRAGHYEAVFG
jgi:hypothetical protein